jgi:excisionase family DNA binding protein
MGEKFIVTNYAREDIVSMIKEAFHEEIKEILMQHKKESDYSALLSRKEVAKLLKISLVTVSKFQREGKLPFSRFGNHIYFKKGDVVNVSLASFYTVNRV